MIIQHNMSALNAHRNLSINNKFTSGNLEKLSSGYRINRAADDAAGLAISEKMRGQIRGLGMAEMNVEHGINLIQTAEGGLQETHAILQRMRELAVQSANGTYEDANDRFNLNKELDALKLEIDRIAESTHYNNIKLLSGNLSGALRAEPSTLTDDSSILAGVSVSSTSTVGAGDPISGSLSVQTSRLTAATLSVDLGDIIAEAVTESAAGAFSLGLNFGGTIGTINVSVAISSTLAQVESAITGAITAAHTGYGAAISGTTLTITAPSTPTDVDVNDAILSASDGLTVSAAWTGASAPIGTTASATTEYTAGTSQIDAVDWIDANSNTHDISGNLDADGNYTYTDASGYTLTLDIATLRAAADKTLGTAATDTLDFDLAVGKGLTFQIGANGDADQRTTLWVENMGTQFIGSWDRDTADGYRYKIEDGLPAAAQIANISVALQGDANSAIKVIDDAINYVSATRADLGAMQNRLEHALSSLGVTKENLTAAESTIRDVDMAKEMMEYTKNSILVQASQAMLAQAQSLPQGVLNLLR